MKRVITLKDSIRRRKEFFAQPASAGFVEFDAIDMHTVLPSSLEWNERDFVCRYGRPSRNGERGCALSHAQLYEEFLEGEDSWLLVAEDDCILPGELAAIMSWLQRALSADRPLLVTLADVWWSHPDFAAGRGNTKRISYLGPRWWSAENVRYRVSSFWPYLCLGSALTLINRPAAQRIHEHASAFGVSWVADEHRLFSNWGVRIVMVSPTPAATNEDFESTIGHDQPSLRPKSNEVPSPTGVRHRVRTSLRRIVGNVRISAKDVLRPW